MKRICVKCQVEFKPEKNGVYVVEMMMKNTKVYKLWRADLLKCPVCGFLIVAGFAQYPMMEHFQKTPDGKIIEEVIEKLKSDGATIIYDKEYPYTTTIELNNVMKGGD